MGCGASGGGGKYEEKPSAESTGSKRSTTATGRSSTNGKPEIRTFDIKDIKETKEIKWHKENCNDIDLRMCRNINEAYPFDEQLRKDYEKKERVAVERGNKHDWGTISIAKLQKEVYCNLCKNFILDRYAENVPFFFCLRCRKERQDGRHLEMCIHCYNDGGLATGARDKAKIEAAGADSGFTKHRPNHLECDQVAPPDRQGRPGTPGHSGSPGSKGGLALPGDPRSGAPAPSPRGSPRPSPRGAKALPLTGVANDSVPSGVWKGQCIEGAAANTSVSGKANTSRQVSVNLFFDKSGAIAGSGPEASSITGSLQGSKVNWTESYQWGTIAITAEMVGCDAISGTFKASDGGKGKISLKASK